jgi:hypothetical protein
MNVLRLLRLAPRLSIHDDPWWSIDPCHIQFIFQVAILPAWSSLDGFVMPCCLILLLTGCSDGISEAQQHQARADHLRGKFFGHVQIALEITTTIIKYHHRSSINPHDCSHLDLAWIDLSHVLLCTIAVRALTTSKFWIPLIAEQAKTPRFAEVPDSYLDNPPSVPLKSLITAPCHDLWPPFFRGNLEQTQYHKWLVVFIYFAPILSNFWDADSCDQHMK